MFLFSFLYSLPRCCSRSSTNVWAGTEEQAGSRAKSWERRVDPCPSAGVTSWVRRSGDRPLGSFRMRLSALRLARRAGWLAQLKGLGLTPTAQTLVRAGGLRWLLGGRSVLLTCEREAPGGAVCPSRSPGPLSWP